MTKRSATTAQKAAPTSQSRWQDNGHTIVAIPLLVMTVICFGYAQYKHSSASYSSSGVSKTSHANQTSSSPYTLTTDQSTPLTLEPVQSNDQNATNSSKQTLTSSAAPQVPDPTNTTTPQSQAVTTQNLQSSRDNDTVDQKSANPQREAKPSKQLNKVESSSF